VSVSKGSALAYHIQLRQFPHNHARFNLAEAELEVIASGWARDEWIEEGDRKWSPHQAKLTILAGRRLEVSELAMGRGWRNAERTAEDVTQRVLAARRGEAAWSAERDAPRDAGAQPAPAEARATAREESGGGARKPTHALSLLADSVGLELLARLDLEPAPLGGAYALAQARLPEHDASERLALAELAVRSLLARRLVEVVQVSGDERAEPRAAAGARTAAAADPLRGEDLELALRALESWVASDAERDRIWVRRA